MPTAYPELLVELLATFFLRGGGSDEVSGVAVRAMEAGLDSPTLSILAGLSGWTSPSELESLLGRVLQELGLPMPDRTRLIRAMARPLAREFLAGRVSPDEFTDRLYALSRQDPQDGHHPWCQLQDDWMLAREGALGSLTEMTERLREEAVRLVDSGD